MSRPPSPTKHSPIPSAQAPLPLRSALRSRSSVTSPRVSSVSIDTLPSTSATPSDPPSVSGSGEVGPKDASVFNEDVFTNSSNSGATREKSETSLIFSEPTHDINARRLSKTRTGTAYIRRVGFDTMESNDPGSTGGGTGIEYSFTVGAKSVGYVEERGRREFLVATDLNEYSVQALNWTLENLAEDGDELIVLRVIEPGSSSQSALKQAQEKAREEAESLLKRVMEQNDDRLSISIIVEFAIGDIEDTIHRMLEVYSPDSLIVGTRGRQPSLWKSAFMGSVSRYCVERSPVPVVVVRPERKVRAALEKRKTDPKRQSYASLISSGPNSAANSRNQSPAGIRPSVPSSTSGFFKERPSTSSSFGSAFGSGMLSPLTQVLSRDEERKGKDKKKSLAMARFKTVG